MKSFNEYVEGIEGKDHEDKENRIMKIAKANFDLAVDQANDYKSLDDAVDAYAQNARESDMEEEGLSADDADTASDIVYRLYEKYKEQLKNKKNK